MYSAMIQLIRYNTSEELPPQIVHEIRSLAYSQWPGSNENQGSGILIDPDLHPVYFVLRDGDHVLGSARTIWTWAAHLGRTLKVYGLGDVITAPQWRRKGYGRRLVAAATAHIRSDPEADIAVLLTEPRLEALYSRSGWVHIAGMRIVTSEDDGAQAAGVVPMMLFLSAGARGARDDFLQQPLVLPGDEW